MGRNSNQPGCLSHPKQPSRFFLDEPGERLLEADRITWECGKDDEDPIGHDRQWRHEILCKYPDDIAVDLARQYLADYEQGGRHGAGGKESAERELRRRIREQRHGPGDHERPKCRQAVANRVRLLLGPVLRHQRALMRPDTEVVPHTHRQPIGQQVGSADDQDRLQR